MQLLSCGTFLWLALQDHPDWSQLQYDGPLMAGTGVSEGGLCVADFVKAVATDVPLRFVKGIQLV